jgi:hypothetical protein
MTKARILANLISDNAELADGQISVAEVVGAAPLASPTFTGNVSVGDNVQIRLGDDDDLQLYHNANNSYLRDVGTGKLHITSDGTGVSIDKGTSELMATFDIDGAVTLYHDNSAKIATSSTGVDITGEVKADKFTNDEALPDIRPSLLLDFANSKTLDPRITFTRGSTATYWDGKTTTKAEENKLKYSQTFTNTAWLQSQVSISDGATTAPDGTTTASSVTSMASTTSQYTRQVVTTFSGTETFSCYAKSNGYYHLILRLQVDGGWNNGQASFNLSNGTVATTGSDVDSTSITSVGNGWYRCSITVTNRTNPDTQIMIGQNDGSLYSAGWTADGTSGIYVWGAQLEQRSSATAYTATTSSPIVKYQPTLQTAASGEARFDHDPVTGESKGLLIEESRVNIQRHSETFGTTWSTTGCSVSGPSAIAPDGTNAAVTIIDNTTTARHGPFDQNNTIVSGSNYTLSCYLKKNYGTDYAQIHFNSGSLGNAWVAVLVNLANGTVENSAAGSAANLVGSGIEDVGNGWYRAYVTGNYASTEAHVKVLISNTASPSRDGYGNINYTGAYTRSILAWGAQLETGSFPTSYIPTSGSTVTRSGDRANMSMSGVYSSGPVSMYVEAAEAGDVDYARLVLLGDGTNDNRMQITISESSGSVQAYVETNDAPQASLNRSFDPAYKTFFKAAAAFDRDNLAITAGGLTTVSDTTIITPQVTNLYLGSLNDADADSGATFKKVALYPTRLSNATLQAMTEE